MSALLERTNQAVVTFPCAYGYLLSQLCRRHAGDQPGPEQGPRDIQRPLDTVSGQLGGGAEYAGAEVGGLTVLELPWPLGRRG